MLRFSSVINPNVFTENSKDKKEENTSLAHIVSVLRGAEHGLTQILNNYYDQLNNATMAIGLPSTPPALVSRTARSEENTNVTRLYQVPHYIDTLLVSLLNIYFTELATRINTILTERMESLNRDTLSQRDSLLHLINNVSDAIVEQMRVLFKQITVQYNLSIPLMKIRHLLLNT